MPDVIWITPDWPWHGEPVGGIFFRTQALALARLGLDLQVVSPTPYAPWPLSRINERWARYAQTPGDMLDGPVRILRPRFPNVPGRPRWALPDRALAAAIWRSRRLWAGARLLHGHYAIHGMATWRVAQRAGIPYVLTFHGDDLNTWPQQNAGRLPDLRAAIRNAALVVAVSEPLTERVHAIAGVEALHIPIGADHDTLAAAAPSRVEARRSLGIADPAFVILFVGAHIREKGVRELAEAILNVAAPALGIFVGGGPEAGYLVDDGRADGRLVYLGVRPHREVARAMAAADVLVLPSHGEGLPSVLVEAGSLGLPVIASRVGGIPQLLAHERGHLLTEVSAAAITAAIEDVRANRPATLAAADRLRRHVREAYDVDRNAARLLGAYRAIVPGL